MTRAGGAAGSLMAGPISDSDKLYTAGKLLRFQPKHFDINIYSLFHHQSREIKLKGKTNMIKTRYCILIYSIESVLLMHLSKSCPTPSLGVYIGDLTFLDVNGQYIGAN